MRTARGREVPCRPSQSEDSALAATIVAYEYMKAQLEEHHIDVSCWFLPLPVCII